MHARPLSVLLALPAAASLLVAAPGCGLSLDVDPPDVLDAGGDRDGGLVQGDAGVPDAGRDAGPPPECDSNGDCFDGLFCNGDEACEGGRCVAGEPPCEDPAACLRAICDEDGDACMGAAIACPDGEICDVDSGACVPPPECETDEDCGADDNPCNGVEQCLMGSCSVASPPLCAPTDDSPCSVPTCDPDAGHCVDVPTDSLCVDEIADDCMFPVCGSDGCVMVPSDLACDDGHACTIDRCMPPTSDGAPAQCRHAPGADPAICDDGAACTYDACNPDALGADAEGCMHMPLDSLCTTGGTSSACGANVCIGADALRVYPSAGGCAPNLSSERCAAGFHCEMGPTTRACIGFADGCTRDSDCDDGNPCNGIEGCISTRCARRTHACPAPGACRTSWCDVTTDPPTCQARLDPSCTPG